jgi:hypothetical protein
VLSELARTRSTVGNCHVSPSNGDSDHSRGYRELDKEDYGTGAVVDELLGRL